MVSISMYYLPRRLYHRVQCLRGDNEWNDGYIVDFNQRSLRNYICHRYHFIIREAVRAALRMSWLHHIQVRFVLYSYRLANNQWNLD
jgi:hypothetical protein